MNSSKIIQLLTDTFEHNHSVDFLTNKKYNARKALMRLQYQEATQFGSVNFNEFAAALSLFPEIQKSNMSSIWQTCQYWARVYPINKITLIQERSRYIKTQLPKELLWHIQFIGVDPNSKKNGYGRQLLESIEKLALEQNRTVVLETSNPESLKFYLHLGYELYHEWNWEKVNFPLWFLKKQPSR